MPRAQASSDILIHMGYLYSLKNDFARSAEYLDRAITLDSRKLETPLLQGVDRFTARQVRLGRTPFPEGHRAAGRERHLLFLPGDVLENRAGSTTRSMRSKSPSNTSEKRARLQLSRYLLRGQHHEPGRIHRPHQEGAGIRALKRRLSGLPRMGIFPPEQVRSRA